MLPENMCLKKQLQLINIMGNSEERKHFGLNLSRKAGLINEDNL